MDDARFMRRALELASRTEGSISPRPPVGAVVVEADGNVVGEGYDTPSPGPHAEIVALDDAGDRARGATVYCTLEPCSHTGATGPCVDALIDAGVRRVVVGVRDPNPVVNGSGLRRLREHGIDVRTGVQRNAATRLIEPFAKWVTTGRPLVTLKMAATLDGKVAAPDGTSRWITGPDAREEVHELRRRVDAVLVGAGTVGTDDPSLTFRHREDGKQPLRVVVTSQARIPSTAKVFDGAAPALVITANDVPAADGGVDLDAALALLGSRGVCHVLCEGGPTLAGSLLVGGLVDRLVLYLAPKIIGGDAPGLFSSGVKTLTDAYSLRIERTRRVGDDICIEARR